MSTKLVKCKVCNEDAAKYRCPRCSMHTCGLKCCKQHKKETGCNGQRDKTAYVPIKGFTDMNLLSDYRLLEDIDRSLWQYRKNQIVNRNNRTHFQIRLLKEAHHRGIKLRLLPDGFKKRKINSSLYVFSQKAIRWHIELQFPKVKQEASLIKVHEGSLLGDELKTYLNSPTTSHLLWRDYRDNFDELTLLVEAEKTKSRKSLYWRVDPSKSISDNLKEHVVLEFPTIHVVTRDELDRYTIEGEETASRSEKESDTSESESEEPPCKRLKYAGEDCRDAANENTQSTSVVAKERETEVTVADVEDNMEDNRDKRSQENIIKDEEAPSKRLKHAGEDFRDDADENTHSASVVAMMEKETCKVISAVGIDVLEQESHTINHSHSQENILADEEPVCKRPRDGKEGCRDGSGVNKVESKSLDATEEGDSQNLGHVSVDVMEVKDR